MRSVRNAALLLILVPFGFIACSPAPPETIEEPVSTATVQQPDPATDTPAAEAVVPIGEASLFVGSEPVSLRDQPSVEPMELFGGETMTPTVGSEIVVGEGGVGLLGWEGFLRSELMSFANLVIDEVDPDARAVSLTQQPGTARYTLPKDVGEAFVHVSAGPVSVDLTGVPSDVIVSHQPAADGEAVVWVVVMDGESTLTTGETEEDTEAITVSKEQVVAYVPGEGFTEVMSIEPVSIEIWYGALTAGRVKPITLAAFRCEVIVESVDVQPEPEEIEADPVAVLKLGHVVDGLGRDEDGTWVQVAGYGITGNAWVPAEALKCIFPIGQMDISQVLLAEAEAELTPTIVATKPVVAVGTGTPTIAPTESSGDQGGDQGSGGNGGNGGNSGGGTTPTEAPTSAEPGAPPTETECVGTDCVAPAPPTDTPRPPRRTKEPTKPPPPTEPPPKPTEPPLPPTEPPPPPATEPPPQPTEPPPPPTDPPAPEPTEGT